jgi:hypothetical protein
MPGKDVQLCISYEGGYGTKSVILHSLKFRTWRQVNENPRFRNFRCRWDESVSEVAKIRASLRWIIIMPSWRSILLGSQPLAPDSVGRESVPPHLREVCYYIVCDTVICMESRSTVLVLVSIFGHVHWKDSKHHNIKIINDQRWKLCYSVLHREEVSSHKRWATLGFPSK